MLKLLLFLNMRIRFSNVVVSGSWLPAVWLWSAGRRTVWSRSWWRWPCLVYEPGPGLHRDNVCARHVSSSFIIHWTIRQRRIRRWTTFVRRTGHQSWPHPPEDTDCPQPSQINRCKILKKKYENILKYLRLGQYSWRQWPSWTNSVCHCIRLLHHVQWQVVLQLHLWDWSPGLCRHVLSPQPDVSGWSQSHLCGLCTR